MASITKLKTSQSIQFFDHSVALNLVQAFHRNLDLGALLTVFFSQAASILQARGMRYRNPDDDIDMKYGGGGPHTSSYNLAYQQEELGELIFNFERPVGEDTLTTAEDLIVLVMSPIKNALAYRRACLHSTSADDSLLPPARSMPAAILNPGDNDMIVLIGLDGIAETRARDGVECAQTLVQSVYTQIRDGLREADGVFQIQDKLLAILLRGSTVAAAAEVAAKLRVLIASLHLKDGTVSTQLTACMGIAGTRHATSADAVLVNGRAALKEAQHEGSNTIRHYQAKQPA